MFKRIIQRYLNLIYLHISDPSEWHSRAGKDFASASHCPPPPIGHRRSTFRMASATKVFYLANHPHSFIIFEPIKQLEVTLLIIYVFKGREEVVMPVNRLKEFLDTNNIKYINVFHSHAYTAQEVAASAHIPGRKLAKTVMVKIDGKIAMAVSSASNKVDFSLLKEAAGASNLNLPANMNSPTCFQGVKLALSLHSEIFMKCRS